MELVNCFNVIFYYNWWYVTYDIQHLEEKYMTPDFNSVAF
jgi:hypothetical protein